MLKKITQALIRLILINCIAMIMITPLTLSERFSAIYGASNEQLLIFEEFFPNTTSGRSASFYDAIATLKYLDENEDPQVLHEERFSQVRFRQNFFSVTLGKDESNLISPDILSNDNVFFELYIPDFDKAVTYNITSIPKVLAAAVAEEVVRVSAAAITGDYTAPFTIKNDLVVKKVNEYLFRADHENKRVSIGKANPQYSLDVDGVINAENLSINGVPLIKTLEWRGDKSIQHHKGRVIVGDYQQSIYDLNVRKGVIKADDFLINGNSILQAHEGWEKLEDGDIYFPLEDEQRAGVGTRIPKAKLDVTEAIKIAGTQAKLPDGGILQFGNDSFSGHFGEDEGFQTLEGIKGVGSKNSLSLWEGGTEENNQESLGSSSGLSIAQSVADETRSLLTLIKDSLLDTHFLEQTFVNFGKTYKIESLSTEDLVTTLKVRSVTNLHTLVITHLPDDKEFLIEFLGRVYSLDEADESFMISMPNQYVVGINGVDPSTVLSLSDKETNEGMLFKTRSSEGDSLLLVNPNGAVGVGEVSDEFALNVKEIVNVGNLFRNGLSISVAYANGTYWGLNKIEDVENIYYNFGTVSLGRADPGETDSLLKIMQTPGKGSKEDPKENQDVGITFTSPGVASYIMGVDAGALRTNLDGSPVLDDNGNQLVKEVFRVEKGVTLGDGHPLFVAENDRLGIGVDFPDANLHMKGDLGLILGGEYDFETELDTPEGLNGSTLMWNPPRGAFRVGFVSSQFTPPDALDKEIWSSSNVGHFSMGLGSNAFPRGNFSAVIGGNNNQAIGPYSTIWGGADNYTNGFFNLLLGKNTKTKHESAAEGDANNYGSFIWSDGHTEDISNPNIKSTRHNNQFLLFATNGVGFNTNNTYKVQDNQKIPTMLSLQGRGVTGHDFIPMVKSISQSSAEELELFEKAGEIWLALRDQKWLTNDAGAVTTNIEALNNFSLSGVDSALTSLSNQVKSHLLKIATLNAMEFYDREGTQLNVAITNRGQMVLGGTSSQGASIGVLNGDVGVGTTSPKARFDIVFDDVESDLLLVQGNAPKSVIAEPTLIANKDGRFGLGGVRPVEFDPEEPDNELPILRTSELRAKRFSFPDGSSISTEKPIVRWDNDSIVRVSQDDFQAFTNLNETQVSNLIDFLHDKTYIDKDTRVRTRNLQRIELTDAVISNVSQKSLDEITQVLIQETNLIEASDVTEKSFIGPDLFSSISGYSQDEIYKALIDAEYLNLDPGSQDCLDQSDISACQANANVAKTKLLLDLNNNHPDEYSDILDYLLSITIINSKIPVEGDIYYTDGSVGIRGNEPGSLLELSNSAVADPELSPIITIDPAFDTSEYKGTVAPEIKDVKYAFGVDVKAPDTFYIEKLNAEKSEPTFNKANSIFSIKDGFVGIGAVTPNEDLSVKGLALFAEPLQLNNLALKDDKVGVVATQTGIDGYILIDGKIVTPWEKTSTHIHTRLHVGVGGDPAKERLTVSGGLKAVGKSGFPDYDIDNLRTDKIKLNELTLRKYRESSAAFSEFGSALQLKKNSLFLDSQNVSNIHSYTELSKSAKQKGLIGFWPDVPKEVFSSIPVSNEYVLAESPMVWHAQYEDESGDTVQGKATMTANLKVDEIYTDSVITSNIQRRIGGPVSLEDGLDRGVQLTAEISNNNALENSKGYVFNQYDLQIDSEGNQDIDDIDATVVNIALQNSKVLGEETAVILGANAVGLRVDVEDVTIQSFEGGSTGYKQAAIFNGRVGIGTNAPQADLDVVGDVIASGFTISNQISIATLNLVAADFIIGADNRVAINTTVAQADLDVHGSILINDIQATDFKAESLDVNNSKFIVAKGKVGIGITDPIAAFDMSTTFQNVSEPNQTFTFHILDLENTVKDFDKTLTGLDIILSSTNKANPKANPNRLGGADGAGNNAIGMDIDLANMFLGDGESVAGLEVHVSDTAKLEENKASTTRKAAIFEGGFVGINTSVPRAMLDLPGGTIKADDIVGKDALTAEQERAKITKLVVTPLAGDTRPVAQINGKAYIDKLVVGTIQQAEFNVTELPLFTEEITVEELYADYLVQGDDAADGVELELFAPIMKVGTLLEAPKARIEKLAVAKSDSNFELEVAQGLSVDKLTVEDALKVAELNINDKLLTASGSAVGVNGDPVRLFTIHDTDKVVYDASDNSTWETLTIQNGSTDANTAAGIMFAGFDATAGSGIAAVKADNHSSAKPGSDLVLITEKSGVQKEAVRFAQDGKVGIGTSTPAFPLEVNGDARFKTVELTSPLKTSSLKDFNGMELNEGLVFEDALTITSLATDISLNLSTSDQVTATSEKSGLTINTGDKELVFSTIRQKSNGQDTQINGVISKSFLQQDGVDNALLYYGDNFNLEHTPPFSFELKTISEEDYAQLTLAKENIQEDNHTFSKINGHLESDYDLGSRSLKSIKQTFGNRKSVDDAATFVAVDVTVEQADGDFDGGNTKAIGLNVDVTDLITKSNLDNGTLIEGSKAAAIFLTSPEESNQSSLDRATGSIAIYTQGDPDVALAIPEAEIHVVSKKTVLKNADGETITDGYAAFQVDSINAEDTLKSKIIFVSDEELVSMGGDISADADFALMGQANQPILTIQEGSNAVMHIDKDGKVGIGTLTPEQDLHVIGTIKANEIDATNLIADNLDFFKDGKGLVVTDVGVGIDVEEPSAQFELKKYFEDPDDFDKAYTLKSFKVTSETEFNKSLTGIDLEFDTKNAFYGDINEGNTPVTSTGINADFSNLAIYDNVVLTGLSIEATSSHDEDESKLSAAIFNGGRVGIGTLSPEADLHVVGDVNAEDFTVTTLHTNNKKGTFGHLYVKEDVSLIEKIVLTDDDKKLTVEDRFTFAKNTETTTLTLDSDEQTLSIVHLIATDGIMKKVMVGTTDEEDDILYVEGNGKIDGDLTLAEDKIVIASGLNGVTTNAVRVLELPNFDVEVTVTTNGNVTAEHLRLPIVEEPTVTTEFSSLFVKENDEDLFYKLKVGDKNIVQSLTKALIGDANSLLVYNDDNIADDEIDVSYTTADMDGKDVGTLAIGDDSDVKSSPEEPVLLIDNVINEAAGSGIAMKQINMDFDKRTTKASHEFVGLEIALESGDLETDKDSYLGLRVDMSDIDANSFLDDGTELIGKKFAAIFQATPDSNATTKSTEGVVGIITKDLDGDDPEVEADLHIQSNSAAAFQVSDDHFLINEDGVISIGSTTATEILTIYDSSDEGVAMLTLERDDGEPALRASVTGVSIGDADIEDDVFAVGGTLKAETSEITTLKPSDVSFGEDGKDLTITEDGLTGFGLNNPTAQFHLSKSFELPKNLEEDFTFQKNTIHLKKDDTDFNNNFSVLDVVYESYDNWLGAINNGTEVSVVGVNVDTSKLNLVKANGVITGLSVTTPDDDRHGYIFDGGHVGVNTSAPTEAFHVVGDVKITGDYIEPDDGASIDVGEGEITETLTLEEDAVFKVLKLIGDDEDSTITVADNTTILGDFEPDAIDAFETLEVETATVTKTGTFEDLTVESGVTVEDVQVKNVLKVKGNKIDGTGDITFLKSVSVTSATEIEQNLETPVITFIPNHAAFDADKGKLLLFKEYLDFDDNSAKHRLFVPPTPKKGDNDASWEDHDDAPLNNHLVWARNISREVDGDTTEQETLFYNVSAQLEADQMTQEEDDKTKLYLPIYNQFTLKHSIDEDDETLESTQHSTVFIDAADLPGVGIVEDDGSISEFGLNLKQVGLEDIEDEDENKIDDRYSFRYTTELNDDISPSEDISLYSLSTEMTGKRNDLSTIFKGLNISMEDKISDDNDDNRIVEKGSLFAGLKINIDSEIKKESSTDAPTNDDSAVVGRTVAALFKSGTHSDSSVLIYTDEIDDFSDDDFKAEAAGTLYVKAREEQPLFRVESFTDSDEAKEYYFGNTINPILILPNLDQNNDQYFVYFGLNSSAVNITDRADALQDEFNTDVEDTICANFPANQEDCLDQHSNYEHWAEALDKMEFGQQFPIRRFYTEKYKSKDDVNVENDLEKYLNSIVNVMIPHQFDENELSYVDGVRMDYADDALPPAFFMRSKRNGLGNKLGSATSQIALGTAEPSSHFDVVSDDGSQDLLNIKSKTYSSIITKDGNVGFGTVSPEALLHVEFDLKEVAFETEEINVEGEHSHIDGGGDGDIKRDFAFYESLLGNPIGFGGDKNPENSDDASHAFDPFDTDSLLGINDKVEETRSFLFRSYWTQEACGENNQFNYYYKLSRDDDSLALFDYFCGKTLYPGGGDKPFFPGVEDNTEIVIDFKVTKYEDYKPFIIENESGSKQPFVIEQNGRISIGDRLYQPQTISGTITHEDEDAVDYSITNNPFVPLDYDPEGNTLPQHLKTLEKLHVYGSVGAGLTDFEDDDVIKNQVDKYRLLSPLYNDGIQADFGGTYKFDNLAFSAGNSKVISSMGFAQGVKAGEDEENIEKTAYLAWKTPSDKKGLSIQTSENKPGLFLQSNREVAIGTFDPESKLHIVGEGEGDILNIGMLLMNTAGNIVVSDDLADDYEYDEAIAIDIEGALKVEGLGDVKGRSVSLNAKAGLSLPASDSEEDKLTTLLKIATDVTDGATEAVAAKQISIALVEDFGTGNDIDNSATVDLIGLHIKMHSDIEDTDDDGDQQNEHYQTAISVNVDVPIKDPVNIDGSDASDGAQVAAIFSGGPVFIGGEKSGGTEDNLKPTLDGAFQVASVPNDVEKDLVRQSIARFTMGKDVSNLEKETRYQEFFIRDSVQRKLVPTDFVNGLIDIDIAIKIWEVFEENGLIDAKGAMDDDIEFQHIAENCKDDGENGKICTELQEVTVVVDGEDEQKFLRVIDPVTFFGEGEDGDDDYFKSNDIEDDTRWFIQNWAYEIYKNMDQSGDRPTLFTLQTRSTYKDEDEEVTTGISELQLYKNRMGINLPPNHELIDKALVINGDMSVGIETHEDDALTDAAFGNLLFFSGGDFNNDNRDRLFMGRFNGNLVTGENEDRSELRVGVGESGDSAYALMSIGSQAEEDNEEVFKHVWKTGVLPLGESGKEGRTLITSVQERNASAPFHVLHEADGHKEDSFDGQEKSYAMVLENGQKIDVSSDAVIKDQEGSQGLAIQTGVSHVNIDETSHYISFIATKNIGASDDYLPHTLGAIEGNGARSISFSSPQADYAEYILKENPAEKFKDGDVVAIKNGRVTKDTSTYDQLMVISSGPIIEGNWPGYDDKGKHALVAFLGQVQVHVNGSVTAGDYILPSGSHDGSAIAVNPERLSPDQVSKIIGRAWEAKTASEDKTINVVVGFPFQLWAMSDQLPSLAEITATVEDMKKNYDKQKARYSHTLEKREALIQTLKRRVAALEK